MRFLTSPKRIQLRSRNSIYVKEATPVVRYVVRAAHSARSSATIRRKPTQQSSLGESLFVAEKETVSMWRKMFAYLLVTLAGFCLLRGGESLRSLSVSRRNDLSTRPFLFSPRLQKETAQFSLEPRANSALDCSPSAAYVVCTCNSRKVECTGC